MDASVLPRLPVAGAVPCGAVRTGVLQEILGIVLDRQISRQEILHLKIRRKGAQFGARSPLPAARIAPAGGEGARGTGLWSFGDLVRLAAILSIAPAPPGLRARVWTGLPDAQVKDRVAELQAQISGLKTDGVRLAKLARVGTAPRRSLADELLFLLPGLNRRYLILPIGAPDQVAVTESWPALPTAPVGIWIDISGILLRSLLAWDGLLPGQAVQGLGAAS